jgi:hypothetical protein
MEPVGQVKALQTARQNQKNRTTVLFFTEFKGFTLYFYLIESALGFTFTFIKPCARPAKARARSPPVPKPAALAYPARRSTDE